MGESLCYVTEGLLLEWSVPLGHVWYAVLKDSDLPPSHFVILLVLNSVTYNCANWQAVNFFGPSFHG